MQLLSKASLGSTEVTHGGAPGHAAILYRADETCRDGPPHYWMRIVVTAASAAMYTYKLKYLMGDVISYDAIRSGYLGTVQTL